MTRAEIVAWLRETDSSRLEELYKLADEVRRAHVGDAVHLRGLIEISNHCVRSCAYCGLQAQNRKVERYRMTAAEVSACAKQAVALGYGSVVLQSGEDFGLTREWMAGVVRTIKRETPLAITLSLGERTKDELAAWRDSGADRYLLRFETSDEALFRAIHPPLGRRVVSRIDILTALKQLGYEAGSGVMIGIPGQTYNTLARDIELFRELDLDMIGVGPWIAHPETPLGSGQFPHAPEGEQTPNVEEMVYKVVALTRIMRPDANIPSTTALATINARNGRELGLQRGANVVMPNLTPPVYRKLYEIYPNKACIQETAKQCSGCLRGRIRSIGRTVGTGQGGRKERLAKLCA